MNKINRRNVIKGLAALPMAATLAPVQSTSSQRAAQIKPGSEVSTCSNPNLSVQFDGVWAFIFEPFSVTAVTPCVEEHSYWVGNGIQTQHLLRGKYHLEGVCSGVAPVIPDGPVIDGIEDIDVAGAYLWISMPFPLAVERQGTSLVSVSFKEVSRRQSTESAPSPQVFPLSIKHVFHYQFFGDGGFALNPSISFPKSNSEIQIRAEQIRGPKIMKDQRHLYRAVERLIALFPKLDMKPVDTSFITADKKQDVKTDTPRNTDVCGAQFSVQP